ncbi:hypothetical protein WJX81_007743 [Elliptochloris bilobata]|uniref:alpha-1,2-Mannosidase n=1 Tax=Elliptochloris bilobata TaxID=381761 RepID=A0AAW1RTX5_9CHLO
MHRGSAISPGSLRPAEDVESPRLASYSKERKQQQGVWRLARLALVQHGRWRWMIPLALLICGCFAFLFGWSPLPGSHGDHAQRVHPRYQGDLDLLIQRAEAERLQTLSELQPVFRHWQGTKDEVKDKRERLRAAQADYDRISELHSERRQAAMAAGDAAQQERLRSFLEKDREVEVRGVTAALDKANEQVSDATWREGLSLERVRRLRREVEALGAALADMRAQRGDLGVNPVKNPRVTGALAGLVPGAAGLLGGSFDRERLLALYAGRVGGGDPGGPGESGGSVASDAQRAGLEEWFAALTADLYLNLGTFGDWTFQRGELPTPSLQRPSAAANSSDVSDASGAGAAQSVNGMRPRDVAAGRRGRAGGAGSEAGSGSAGASGTDEDDSVRCRMAAICEGAAACQPGDELGCASEAAVRQEHVRDAIRWSWKGYRDHAWGQDELRPLSRAGSKWFNLGLTLADSLDTLLLAGLEPEYEEARRWVAEELATDGDEFVNTFETTIRVLSGLLSAFLLSPGDPVFLFRAVDLGLRLSAAFQSASGIPFSDVNLRTHATRQPEWTAFSSLSEATTLSLEFATLAQVSGESELEAAAMAVAEKVMSLPGRTSGLAPIFVDPATGTLAGGLMTLGARGDSYYEYLLKQWLLGGKHQPALLKGYKEAMRGVRERLLQRTVPGRAGGGLAYVGELHGGVIVHKMDHLVCFLPGLLALGHLHGVSTARSGEQSDLDLAKDLMATCNELYRRTPAGLAPEIAFFTPRAGDDYPKRHAGDVGGGDFTVKPQDAHNLLRPETVESLFVLWRVTGDARYREWGWHMFRAWHRFCRVPTGGFANLESVLTVPPPQRDKMESFWLAETLKYLYLLFDDSQPVLIPLDQFVLNTEAHPLPITGSVAASAAAAHARKGPRGSGPSKGTLDERLQAWAEEWRRLAGNATSGGLGRGAADPAERRAQARPGVLPAGAAAQPPAALEYTLGALALGYTLGEWEATDAAAAPGYFTAAGAAPAPSMVHQALEGAAADLFAAATALDDAAILVRVAAGAPVVALPPNPPRRYGGRRGRRGLRGMNPKLSPIDPIPAAIQPGIDGAMSPRAAGFVTAASAVDTAFDRARAALRRVAPGALGPAAGAPAGLPQASALDAARDDFARAAAELADAANEIRAAAAPAPEPKKPKEPATKETPVAKKKRGLKAVATGEKQAKKKATSKDNTGPKIKNACTAYIFFSSDKRSEVKAAHPEYSLAELSKELEAGDEDAQAPAAKGVAAKKTKAKRKRGEESKPAGEDKADTGISMEDLAERMDVDWQAHPAECILTQTRDGTKFVVKRAGLGFAEFGLVDARAAKRQRAEGAPAEGAAPPLPLTLVDEYERYTAKFHAAVHDHTEDGELDLEDLAPGSLLDACSFLGYMREEPFLLNRAVKGRDTTMRVPTLGLSLLVQRMVGAEAAKRAEADAEARGLRTKVKELEMKLEQGKLLTAGEE